MRIPKHLLESVLLGVDDTFELREESGRIVIEPLERKEFKLDELLRGITKKNVHREVDFGELAEVSGDGAPIRS